MKDWKHNLEKIKEAITNDEELVIKDEAAKPAKTQGAPTKTKPSSKRNFAEDVQFIQEQIVLEKSKPPKRRNPEKILTLQVELKLAQDKLNDLITKLRVYYPKLTFSQISSNLSTLVDEINTKIRSSKEEEKEQKRKADERMFQQRQALAQQQYEYEKANQKIFEQKEQELISDAKTLIKEHSIELCDECSGKGTLRIFCPECNGTKFCSPRPVMKSVAGICTNTSPNCAHCFGTGVFTVEKKVYTSDCSCKTGVVSQSCKKCGGNSLAVKTRRGLVTMSQSLVKTISQRENLMGKIRSILVRG
jgi:hypothetical protein